VYFFLCIPPVVLLLITNGVSGILDFRKPFGGGSKTPDVDDEGDIFEEDEEYLFVRQGICAKDRIEIKSSSALPKLLRLKCYFR
jgi:hypothetical protein